MLITKGTIEQLNEIGWKMTFFKVCTIVDSVSECDSIYLSYRKDDIIKSVDNIKPLKKKEMDFDWFMEKIDNKYDNKLDKTSYVELFRNLSKKIELAHPTTFGFSITTYAPKSVEKCKKYLDENGIVYKLLCSEAGWCYRFIISKKSDNIKKIKNLA